MYTLYKFHFLNGISEINQLFDDILIIWPAPVYRDFLKYKYKNKNTEIYTVYRKSAKKIQIWIVVHIAQPYLKQVAVVCGCVKLI